MNNKAIYVENVGKSYRIGSNQGHYRTLRDTMTDAFVAPFRRAGKLLRGQATGAAELDEIFWALKNISFEVKSGDVIGIIGRNGAGKSTLLKILSRITEPTEGHAMIHGRVGSLLEVGTGFHPELTGRENIFLNGAILGMKRTEIKRQFEKIVSFAEVEKFINTPVKHYSSGMYLRLAFSVAAHLELEILLVDEVLAVGDAAFQKKCLGKMSDVAKQGRTVLFVSHNMKAISNLTDTCICLDEGKIVSRGETQSVINEYISKINTLISSDGWADLTVLERHSVCRLRKARFDWVKLLDNNDNQSGSFMEGEPITVELGFQVMEQVESIQFGCGVMTVDGSTSLFTTPSYEFREMVKPGNYSIRVYFNPNYLRHGDYTLAVKLFADGLREDTIGQVIGLNIKPPMSFDDNPAYAQRWVAGYTRFDYKWGGIESNNVTDKVSIHQEN